jgi:hypothetical protein
VTLTRALLASLGALGALALLAGPAPAAALEPRYDHRGMNGVLVEPLLAHDTVSITGHGSHSRWRPTVRLAYGWDVLGEGNELFLGVQSALTGWSDPRREKIRLAVDARYRSYFGTEQWKTFFELGLWAPVSSRLVVGPLVGLGVAYDFSRNTGLFLDGGFATGLGQARVATFTVSGGAAFRF